MNGRYPSLHLPLCFPPILIPAHILPQPVKNITDVNIRFFQELKITGDEVRLTYTMPLVHAGISEKNGEMSIVENGGRYCTVGRTRTFELAFSLIPE